MNMQTKGVAVIGQFFRTEQKAAESARYKNKMFGGDRERFVVITTGSGYLVVAKRQLTKQTP